MSRGGDKKGFLSLHISFHCHSILFFLGGNLYLASLFAPTLSRSGSESTIKARRRRGEAAQGNYLGSIRTSGDGGVLKSICREPTASGVHSPEVVRQHLDACGLGDSTTTNKLT